MRLTASSIEQLPHIAQQILALGKRKIAFYGDLGAGKTALIRAICLSLGITDTIASPTYALIHVYHTPQGEEIYHADFYRLQTNQDAINIGVLDILDNDNYFFIEWPSVIETFFDDKVLQIHISLAEDNISRVIEVF